MRPTASLRCRTQDRDRTHAPDSRPYVLGGTSSSGRCTLWSAWRIAFPVEQTPGGGHARDARAGSEFSALGSAGVNASPDQRVAQVLPPVAGGTGHFAG